MTMSKKDKLVEEVQGTEIPQSEEVSAPEVTPVNSKPDDFFSMLKSGYIKEGDKIAFTPVKGKEIDIIVDKAFLKLPIQEKKYYVEYGYKLVK